MVLLTHTAFTSGVTPHGTTGAVLARFDFGVAIFFVLSGFLLYRPFALALLEGRRSPSTKHYLTRRAQRILPAYWVALVVVLLVDRSATNLDKLAHVGLLQVYVGRLLPDFTQTWSLSTEVAFYLVLPLLAAAAAAGLRRRRATSVLTAHLVGVAVVTIGCWAFVGLVSASPDPQVRRMAMWLPAHLDWFAVGMTLAVVWTVRHELPSHGVVRALQLADRYPGSLLSAALVAFWFATTPIGGPRLLTTPTPAQAVAKEAAYAVSAGLVVAVAAFARQSSGPVAAALANGPARYLGRISYPVFLWHLLVIRAVLAATGWPEFSGHFIGLTVLTAAGSVAVAAASWRFVERPWLVRGKRLYRGRRTIGGSTDAAATSSEAAHSS